MKVPHGPQFFQETVFMYAGYSPKANVTLAWPPTFKVNTPPLVYCLLRDSNPGSRILTYSFPGCSPYCTSTYLQGVHGGNAPNKKFWIALSSPNKIINLEIYLSKRGVCPSKTIAQVSFAPFTACPPVACLIEPEKSVTTTTIPTYLKAEIYKLA